MNFRTFVFQNFTSFNYLSLRSCKNFPGGIKYPGFIYYPRTEDFKDPPYEPSKLFLVIRYKRVSGTNFQEKEILKSLSLDGKKEDNGHIAVVKNTPSVNALLWKVKHLIQIKPITWKGELPKDNDFSGTYLRNTGELVISPRLKLSPSKVNATEKYLTKHNKLGRKYFTKYLREKWNIPFTGDV